MGKQTWPLLWIYTLSDLKLDVLEFMKQTRHGKKSGLQFLSSLLVLKQNLYRNVMTTPKSHRTSLRGTLAERQRISHQTEIINGKINPNQSINRNALSNLIGLGQSVFYYDLSIDGHIVR